LAIPGHVAVASVVCVIWKVDFCRLSCSNSTGLLKTAVARVDRLRSRCCDTCKGNVQVTGQLGDKESTSIFSLLRFLSSNDNPLISVRIFLYVTFYLIVAASAYATLVPTYKIT
jgi:hypothetical protein